MIPTQGLGPAQLAAITDHTLLRPEATAEDVRAAVAEAVSFGCATVCVQPHMVPVAVEVADGRIPVCSVVGFPHGANLGETKAVEAAAAVAQGASELDMVADLSAIAERDDAALRLDIARVRAAVPHAILKVIIESALWSGPDMEAACEAVVLAGADFVKTSSGFHPSGGATSEAVTRMKEATAGRALVKAAGGIRDASTALAMVGAGADRIGMSATAAVVSELAAGNSTQ
jgi:deoxyribose-phosphate aldolase